MGFEDEIRKIKSFDVIDRNAIIHLKKKYCFDRETVKKEIDELLDDAVLHVGEGQVVVMIFLESLKERLGLKGEDAARR